MAIEIINQFEESEEDYKRFMLFGCHTYYPNGDLGDVIGSFETLVEAKENYLRENYDYKVIFDRIGNKTYFLKNQ